MDFLLRFDPLTTSDREQITQLAQRAHEADGAAPLNDQSLVNLHSDDTDITHIVARLKSEPGSQDGPSGQILGYAQVDRRPATITGELVVDPQARNHGIGRALLRSAIRDATLPSRSGEPGQHTGLHVWSHSDHPAAAALARTEGLVPVRQITFMIRPVGAEHPATVDDAMSVFDDEFSVRTIATDTDNEAWLKLNSVAFANHPEQGAWQLADLVERQRSSWFDPHTCFVVTPKGDDANIVATVWLKYDPMQASHGEAEIYVLAVDPSYQGRGFGHALVDLALAHFAQHDISQAQLWTDASNAAANKLYESSGFQVAATHIQYAHRPGAPGSL